MFLEGVTYVTSTKETENFVRNDANCFLMSTRELRDANLYELPLNVPVRHGIFDFRIRGKWCGESFGNFAKEQWELYG